MPVPAGLVTATRPLGVQSGTSAVKRVLLTTVNDGSRVLPSLTAVALPKFVPLMVKVTGRALVAGVKELMVGALITVKVALLVRLSRGVSTVNLPLAAPTGTVAEISVSLTIVKAAGLVPSLTALAMLKPTPLSDTF